MKLCKTPQETSEKSNFRTRFDDYLKERFDYKTACISFPSSHSINVDARKAKFDLYIRIFEERHEFWGGKAIVMSRIEFKDTRKGHGTDLLKFVTNFAREFQYDVIGIEQVSSPSIKQFADKHRFQRVGDTDNYKATVRELYLLLKS